MNKICRFCGKQKSVNEFYLKKNGQPRSKCIECFAKYTKERREKRKETEPDFIEKNRQRQRQWRKNNAEYLRKKSREKYAKNPEYYVSKSIAWQKKNWGYIKNYNRLYSRKYRDKFPWARTLNSIRCRIRENPYYKNIKNDLTLDSLMELWYRDKAYLMKKPSIDRIDPKGDYTMENCRYIELSQNVINGNKNKQKYITRSLNNKRRKYERQTSQTSA